MFKTDMQSQGKKLMDTLALAVAFLNTTGSVKLLLEDTAKNHRAYGAKPEHYKAVGEALIWMFEKKLGAAFKPEVRTAWYSLYQQLATTMQELSETR